MQSPSQQPAAKPAQVVVKQSPADLERQRAFIEKQLVERELNAAMAQVHAQAKAQQQIAGMVRTSFFMHLHDSWDVNV